MARLTVGGIEMSAEKKRIKHMYIRVVPPRGEVRITAPLRTPDSAIRAFALSRVGWIEKQRRRLLSQPEQREYRYVTGERHPLWGEEYPLEVVHGEGRGRVSLADRKIVLQVRPDSSTEQRAKLLGDWYREILRAAIPAVFDRCENIVGAKASGWQIRAMRTRWGSCNTVSGKICLNLQLVYRPPRCLQYVVIHELTHLLERSHNRTFKNYIDQFLPDWREAAQALSPGRDAEKQHT